MRSGWKRTRQLGARIPADLRSAGSRARALRRLDKNVDFIGKAALAEKKAGGRLRLVAFIVEAKDAECIGDEPIWHKGKVVGWVTSGGYAHAQKSRWRSAMCRRKSPTRKTGWEIEILGDMCKARLQAKPLLDPKGEKMRG